MGVTEESPVCPPWDGTSQRYTNRSKCCKQAVLRKLQHTQYRFVEHPKEIFKDKYSTLIFTHYSFP